MLHGSQAFFDERARSRRHVAAVSLTTSLTLLALLFLARVPTVQRAFERLDLPHRFGFEGPDQYVRRITLEMSPPAPFALRNGARVQPIEARRGGVAHHQSSRDAQARPRPVSRYTGEGVSEADLLARARAMYRHAPVVQSEDLVIEKLVRPEYPEDAREAGIEGRVALVALVDTTGSVVDVDMVGSSNERSLERAATVAVWQCKFRPYRVDGHTQEVYAIFRFNFHME
jgi:TonB family protein